MAFEPLPFTASSHVKDVQYDEDAKELMVTYNGGSYIYSNIDQQIADQLSAAPSAGSYLHNVVKADPSTYPYRKV